MDMLQRRTLLGGLSLRPAVHQLDLGLHVRHETSQGRRGEQRLPGGRARAGCCARLLELQGQPAQGGRARPGRRAPDGGVAGGVQRPHGVAEESRYLHGPLLQVLRLSRFIGICGARGHAADIAVEVAREAQCLLDYNVAASAPRARQCSGPLLTVRLRFGFRAANSSQPSIIVPLISLVSTAQELEEPRQTKTHCPGVYILLVRDAGQHQIEHATSKLTQSACHWLHAQQAVNSCAGGLGLGRQATWARRRRRRGRGACSAATTGWQQGRGRSHERQRAGSCRGGLQEYTNRNSKLRGSACVPGWAAAQAPAPLARLEIRRSGENGLETITIRCTKGIRYPIVGNAASVGPT
mmetsp:Transcript_106127/g.300093  ORF Transcript_106127/g.300093 Transcript_106127/m.300093 type:complete len:353 (+) Transcript_106127:190-1248(+)